MGKRVMEEPVAKPATKSEGIITRHRPRRFKDVLGQGAAAKSLEVLLRDPGLAPHCYLFTGPAGTGKTTLARIVASALEIDATTGIIEVDAASNTGVDDVRALTAGLRYNGFGETPGKAIILNECHRLSAQAWDALLMTTEEPPSHVYFFFTSTDPAKIPKAMVTRCTSYALLPLRYDDLMDLLEEVVEKEGMEPRKGILEAVATAAEGSARQALSLLAKVHACEDLDEARLLLQVAGENPEAITLARDLVAGKLTWSAMTKALKALAEQGVQPESIRLMLVNYLNACLMGSDSEKRTVRLLDMLECFMKPAIGPEKMAPLLIAFGRYIYPD